VGLKKYIIEKLEEELLKLLRRRGDGI